VTTEIFRCVSGSRQFGTSTPASDTDIKAVHVPDARDILLGCQGVIRDKADTDFTSYPLADYLRLLARMDFGALEMLHAPNETSHWLWNMLYDDRFRVMSRNKEPFIRYAKSALSSAPVKADMKGLYHAHRIVDEAIELFGHGTIQFPCRNRNSYLMIRSGEVPRADVVIGLEEKLLMLERVEPISLFPETPDTDWIDEFVFAAHEQMVLGNYEKWKAASTPSSAAR